MGSISFYNPYRDELMAQSRISVVERFVSKEKVLDVVEGSTGEVTHSSAIFDTKDFVYKDDYVFLKAKGIAALKKIKNIATIRVWVMILERLDKGREAIGFYESTIKEYMPKTSYYRGLKELKELDFVRVQDRLLYINPAFYFKGKVTFSPKG